jgi:endonuclease YncB( thermonuclease family)
MIYIYQAELVRVVDSDTVDLVIDLGFDTSRRERFRLYGIDAPGTITAAGKEAKKWLWDTLQPLEAIYVQTIQLETKAKRDKYGRFLAVLYKSEAGMEQDMDYADAEGTQNFFQGSINRRMIVEGHAKGRYW